MRSFSRLILWSAFSRLMVARDDSAITVFICSFSASKSNGLRLPFLPFLLDDKESFVKELRKEDPEGIEVDPEDLCEGPAEGVVAAAAERRVASSSSSSPKGFASVSRMTLERSCVTPIFLLGSSYTCAIH